MHRNVAAGRGNPRLQGARRFCGLQGLAAANQPARRRSGEGRRISCRRCARKRSRESNVDRDLECAQRNLSCIINHACAKEGLYMVILYELLGGGQRQKEYRDFIERYEQGDPSEGYSDQEVLKRY